MPIGAQSLQPYQSSVYTGDTAAVYKAKLDANGSIASNVAGVGYVYPTSPASLNVNVDLSYNVPQLQHGFQVQGSNAAATVGLTAPGSSYYYATVYLDALANALGVAYSPLGAPGPILPDYVHQVALASVYLAAGQSTVTAGNLQDLRCPLLQNLPLTYYVSSGITNPYNFDCRHADRINLFGYFGGSCTIILNNLRMGSIVSLQLGNNNSGASTVAFGAYTPSGAVYKVWSRAGANYVNFGTTGVSFPAGQVYQFWGATVFESPNPALFFSAE